MIGHRGAAAVAPENTLESLGAAVAAGADLVEFDVCEGLVLGLGAVGTVFVLIRVISIPDAVLPADSRGIGLWIALVAALGVIAGGLLRAAEDL